MGVGLLGAAADNPLHAVARVAADVGGWDAGDLQFAGGGYGYRLFYFRARGQMLATTPQGEVANGVRFIQLPLPGIFVRCYSEGAPDRCLAGQ